MPKKKDKSKSKSKYRIKSKNNKNKNSINIKIIGGQGGGGGGSSSYIPHVPHHQDIDYDRIRNILHQSSPRSSLIPNSIQTPPIDQAVNTTPNEPNDNKKETTPFDNEDNKSVGEMSDGIPLVVNPMYMRTTTKSDIQEAPVTNLNNELIKKEFDDNRKKIYEDKQVELEKITKKLKKENEIYKEYNDAIKKLQGLKDKEMLNTEDDLRKQINKLTNIYGFNVRNAKSKSALMSKLNDINPQVSEIHQRIISENEERIKNIQQEKNSRIGPQKGDVHTFSSFRT